MGSEFGQRLCKSGRSCVGIAPGENRPKYIKTCLAATCHWTWCDGRNFSLDQCVYDQGTTKTGGPWCSSDDECSSTTKQNYVIGGSPDHCIGAFPGEERGVTCPAAYPPMTGYDGKKKLMHRECTQTNDSGCVYWCEGPDPNKRYPCYPSQIASQKPPSSQPCPYTQNVCQDGVLWRKCSDNTGQEFQERCTDGCATDGKSCKPSTKKICKSPSSVPYENTICEYGKLYTCTNGVSTNTLTCPQGCTPDQTGCLVGNNTQNTTCTTTDKTTIARDGFLHCLKDGKTSAICENGKDAATEVPCAGACDPKGSADKQSAACVANTPAPQAAGTCSLFEKDNTGQWIVKEINGVLQNQISCGENITYETPCKGRKNYYDVTTYDGTAFVKVLCGNANNNYSCNYRCKSWNDLSTNNYSNDCGVDYDFLKNNFMNNCLGQDDPTQVKKINVTVKVDASKCNGKLAIGAIGYNVINKDTNDNKTMNYDGGLASNGRTDSKTFSLSFNPLPVRDIKIQALANIRSADGSVVYAAYWKNSNENWDIISSKSPHDVSYPITIDNCN